MLNSRNSFLREVIIDRCLRSKVPMSRKEIENELSKFLEAHDESKGDSKDTVLRDINSIEDRWGVKVNRIRKGKVVYYQYAEPCFSIYQSILKAEDLVRIKETIKVLRNYVGLPHCEWIEDISARLQAYTFSEPDEDPIVCFSHNPDYADNLKHFNPLFEYIKSKSAIELTYKKFNSEKETTRILHPYRLKEFDSRWYVVGWCKEHPDHPSCYGLERIINFIKSGEVFVENPGFDIEEYFRSMYGITIYDGSVPQEVLFWVSNDQYPYIKTNPIHDSQKFVREEDGGKIISLHLFINYELVMRLFSYNIGVKVLAPAELRQEMKKRVKIMYDYYYNE